MIFMDMKVGLRQYVLSLAVLIVGAAGCQQKSPEPVGQGPPTTTMPAEEDSGHGREQPDESAAWPTSLEDRASLLARSISNPEQQPFFPGLFAEQGPVVVTLRTGGDAAAVTARFDDSDEAYQCLLWRAYADWVAWGPSESGEELCKPLASVLDKFAASTVPSATEPSKCDSRCCDFPMNADEYPSLHLRRACLSSAEDKDKFPTAELVFEYDASDFDEPRQDIWQRSADLVAAFNQAETSDASKRDAAKKKIMDRLPSGDPVRVHFSRLEPLDDGPKLVDKGSIRLDPYDVVDCWMKALGKPGECSAPKPADARFDDYVVTAPAPVRSCHNGCCKLGYEGAQTRIPHRRMMLTEICYDDSGDGDAPSVERLELLMVP